MNVDDRIIERYLPSANREREQGGVENLSDRGEVEQRVGIHSPMIFQISHAVIEEERFAADPDRDRGTADAVARQHAVDFPVDQAPQIIARLRPHGGERHAQDCHCQKPGSDPHPITPSNEKMNVESNGGVSLWFRRD